MNKELEDLLCFASKEAFKVMAKHHKTSIEEIKELYLLKQPSIYDQFNKLMHIALKEYEDHKGGE
jgi:hypothetical protein